MRGAAFFAALLSLIAWPVLAEPLPTISARAVPFHQTDVTKQAEGQLRFVGGYELTSKADWFGGWSGMALDKAGTKLRLISDKAHWMDVDLAANDKGVPTAFTVTAHGALDVGAGLPLVSRLTDFDAEEIIDLSEKGDLAGPFLASFERKDRVLRYETPDAEPVLAFTPPNALKMNEGLEAVTRLADGRLLMLSEGTVNEAGNGLGWIASADFKEITPIFYKPSGEFQPTAVAQLPKGDLLVLERSYSPLVGVAMQLRLVSLADEVLDGPVLVRLGGGYTIDNFEGMAVRQTPKGDSLVYVVSDDNFNPAQRTLFMVYELKD